MGASAIELTAEERTLVGRIDFNPSSEIHDADYWLSVGTAAHKLMESLIARKAIPEVRTKFFTDPVFNIGGRGRSRFQIFEKNGTRGDAIFRHPHFLKYLHYFLYGPDLPAKVVEAFQGKVAACGWVTSGDIIPLGKFARQLTRAHGLDAGNAAEEFYKLALDCGLDASDAHSMRDAVKKAR
jgi:hypothetical protein